MADADVEIWYWRSVNGHALATWFDRALGAQLFPREINPSRSEYEDNSQSGSIGVCCVNSAAGASFFTFFFLHRCFGHPRHQPRGFDHVAPTIIIDLKQVLGLEHSFPYLTLKAASSSRDNLA